MTAAGAGWLYPWFDEYAVTSVDRARRLIDDKPIRLDLESRAMAALRNRAPAESDGTALVAGRGLDLSGHLDCYGWECLRLQVDRLLVRVWHYFDKVVVVGPSARDALHLLEHPTPEATERFLTFVRLLLYVREIGAEELLTFREKPVACHVHWKKHARAAGLTDLPKLWQPWLRSIAKSGKFSIKEHEDHWDYTFVHPLFEHTQWGAIDKPGANEQKTARKIAAAVGRRYYAELTTDVATARECKMAMGSTLRPFKELLALNTREVFPEDVAFDISLPFLDGVNVKSLMKIRADEADAFLRCQSALRIAIKERIGSQGSTDPAKVALEIEQDVIAPSIADLNQRLRAARRALQKKGAVSLGLGGIVTTCGLLTGISSVELAGPAAAALTFIEAIHRSFDGREGIRESDLYFMWAGSHARHN